MKQKTKNRFINLFDSTARVLIPVVTIGLLSFAISTSAIGQDTNDWPKWNDAPSTNQTAPKRWQDPNWKNYTSQPNQAVPAKNNEELRKEFRQVISNGTKELDPVAPVELTFDTTIPEIKTETTVGGMLKNELLPKIQGMLGSVSGEGSWFANIRSQLGSSNTKRMLGSLAIVLGGYFAFVWLMRTINGKTGTGRLPKEVVEMLGAAPFGPRKSLQLVRLGSKLLLLLNGPDGTSTLGEITEPNEVEYLVSLCSNKKQSNNGGVSTILSRLATRQPQTQSAPSPSNGSAAPNLNQILQALQNAGQQPAGNVFEA